MLPGLLFATSKVLRKILFSFLHPVLGLVSVGSIYARSRGLCVNSLLIKPTNNLSRGLMNRYQSFYLSSSSVNLRPRCLVLLCILMRSRDRPCVFCKRVIPHDDYDLHYVMCLTRPRVTYNEDTLQSDKGECAICLEDMKAGDLIARLPCLYLPQKVHRRLVPKKANLSRTPRRLGACESRIVLNFTSFVVKNNMHCGCIDTLEPRAKSSSVHNIITPPFHFRISLRHICSSQEHPRCLLTWPVRARDGSGQLFSFFHFHRLDELSLDELFSLKCERSVVAYMFYLKYLINWHPYPK
uniref:RING-type E3 ubiquitin transferase n=1 Tax=Mesocestoides corti TaxID=53468 RepID=A0A5K3ENV3_MESCO